MMLPKYIIKSKLYILLGIFSRKLNEMFLIEERKEYTSWYFGSS